MSNSIDSYLSTNASALQLRAQRASLLASNLANADTPNYKARDFDFSEALRTQLSNAGSTLEVTNPGHIAAPAGQIAASDLLYRVPQEPSLDGNTVDTDVEQAEFAENAVRYQASLEFLGKRISGLIRTLRSE
ncbi:flagellar basal body rod protein FlgB [Granulosicoccaceae sp. 1_MG-2023]|nr:flagellar basal body rod protein FlgB [Granulosicoccaceae sp. 1_MG-2023]